MTCEDPDDFQTTRERCWSADTDFKAHDPVILWRSDASEPPAGQAGYVRSGDVVKVVLAGEVVEDPEMVRYDLRSRAGRKAQEQYHDTREAKVVVRVRAEDSHAVPWDELPDAGAVRWSVRNRGHAACVRAYADELRDHCQDRFA